jgi:hypothetical protein
MPRRAAPVQRGVVKLTMPLLTFEVLSTVLMTLLNIIPLLTLSISLYTLEEVYRTVDGRGYERYYAVHEITGHP